MTQKGFSLIEVSIALIIIGLLAAPFISEYEVWVYRQNKENTEGALKNVATALADYVALNDRLPCPARLDLAYGAEDHGKEAAIVGTTGCNAGDLPAVNTCEDGICRTNTDTTGGENVVIGAVPYATLGLKYDEGLDNWKRKLTYVVTEDLANGSLADYDPALGGIILQSQQGVGVAGLNNNQPYLLISHGATGAGAYSVSGVLADVCPDPLPVAIMELENCDNDGTFVVALKGDGQRNDNFGPAFNDDLIRFEPLSSGSEWLLKANAVDMENKGLGKVGIKKPDPTTGAPLQVGGEIRVTGQINADRWCHPQGYPCFFARIIGGSGEDCGIVGDVRAAMTGIQEYTRLRCSDSNNNLTFPPGYLPSGASGNCPTSFMTGIDASGNVTCL